MTSRGHVSSPLPPPPACDKPDEEAPLEVDSDSSSDGEGVVGASKASELGHSPSSDDEEGDGDGNDDCESTADLRHGRANLLDCRECSDTQEEQAGPGDCE